MSSEEIQGASEAAPASCLSGKGGCLYYCRELGDLSDISRARELQLQQPAPNEIGLPEPHG